MSTTLQVVHRQLAHTLLPRQEPNNGTVVDVKNVDTKSFLSNREKVFIIFFCAGIVVAFVGGFIVGMTFVKRRLAKMAFRAAKKAHKMGESISSAEALLPAIDVEFSAYDEKADNMAGTSSSIPSKEVIMFGGMHENLLPRSSERYPWLPR
ncbi:hypothetical protein B0H66DRAFT_217037 [Apodospora peruviana]|uniref:Uncharacterized protein n=1 Tax=Apodospora peruviana TaxID=516989 RepID=A0AAE0ID82_9PEZI|nr:hypothetical protein B0H66DRAFT_217037 [Apodospora peruviana]